MIKIKVLWFLKIHWYDYGARMYDPVIARWNVIDPLSEDYYSWTTYQYVRNNPIIYIDPNGMSDTGYQVDDEGNITKLNEEGGDVYDVLYKKETYSESKRKDYDESGTKTGIKLSKGVISSKNVTKYKNNKTGEIKYQNIRYESSSDSEATNLLIFLDKNTSVEWSNTYFENETGGKLNLLMTSQEDWRIYDSFNKKDSYVGKGYKIVRDDHIHPDENPHSGPGPSGWEGDFGHGAWLLKFSPNAKFRILYRGKFYPYKIPKQ